MLFSDKKIDFLLKMFFFSNFIPTSNAAFPQHPLPFFTLQDLFKLRFGKFLLYFAAWNVPWREEIDLKKLKSEGAGRKSGRKGMKIWTDEDETEDRWGWENEPMMNAPKHRWGWKREPLGTKKRKKGDENEEDLRWERWRDRNEKQMNDNQWKQEKIK